MLLFPPDLKLTIVIRLTSDVLPADFKKLMNDPETGPEFRKDMAADPQTALMMGLPVTVTRWAARDKVRVDFGTFTMVTTQHPEKMIAFDRRTKQRTEVPPEREVPSPKAAVLKVKDTGRTRTIVGHLTHEWSVNGKGSDGMPVVMRVWVAPDLPYIRTDDSPFFRQLAPSERNALQKIHGAALRFEIVMPNGHAKPAIFSSQVVSLSTAPIADETFAIPDK